MRLDGLSIVVKPNSTQHAPGAGSWLLTPVVLHASGSGRHSPQCFCSGGRPNPTENRVLKMTILMTVIKSPHGVFPTCILVFTTSRGVFPKTLAAPAVAPNIAVTIGCMSRPGSSPKRPNPKVEFMGNGGKWEENQSIGQKKD